jgi:hypothetical protein
MTDHTLNRLSAANPFPGVPTVDADALFDRIVAAPGDRRLAGTPAKRRRGRTFVLVTALVACGLLASAAYGISSLLGDVIGGSTVKAEYAKAKTELTLPPGYTWPKLHWPAHTVTSRGAGGGFAVGFDQGAWECYWVAAIHSGDAAAARRAHTALNDLMAKNSVVAPAGASENWSPPIAADTPTQVFADDGGFQYKQRMYAAAAAGNPQQLEQSCRNNGPATYGR